MTRNGLIGETHVGAYVSKALLRQIVLSSYHSRNYALRTHEKTVPNWDLVCGLDNKPL
jgi:hypothetical protein